MIIQFSERIKELRFSPCERTRSRALTHIVRSEKTAFTVTQSNAHHARLAQKVIVSYRI